MRVAIFTDNDFNKVNGVTTTLRALLRCAPPDLTLRVYTADEAGAEEPEYLSVPAPGVGIPFYRDMKVYFPSPFRYLRLTRQDGIDLVHVTTPGPVGVMALFVAWRLGVPIVGSFHTDLARYATILSRSRFLGTLVGWYLRWMYGRCERVLVPSQATSAALRTSGVVPTPHVIWRRGVDTRMFSPARRSQALRRAWGADEDTVVIMYLGRVSREKNLAVFGALEARVAASGHPYRLVFVGDGPMRHEIQRRLPTAIVTGSIPHDQVGAYLASADIFAFPSRTDTAGNVVLEAQASGLPVVITDEGGPREHVSAGKSALVTDGDDEQAFVSAVEQLVSNRDLRRAMGAAARTFALTCDWPTSFAPLFETYRALTPDVAPDPSPLALRRVLGSDQST